MPSTCAALLIVEGMKDEGMRGEDTMAEIEEVDTTLLFYPTHFRLLSLTHLPPLPRRGTM